MSADTIQEPTVMADNYSTSGLMGSLLVGVSFAKGFARSLNIPMIDVNHLQAHVLAHFIKAEGEDNVQPEFLQKE